jgi:predicted dehydrogenase
MQRKAPIRISRRKLLGQLAGGLTGPLIVRSTVFGTSAPSNRLNLGSIGNGRMGRGDMSACLQQSMQANARVMAVCDLDSNRAAAAKAVVDKFYADNLGKSLDCKIYGDYRELLARDDIDGVTISTPDHWHAVCAVAAAKAGKDIYLQKPLTYTLGEGRQLVQAVRENGRILQTGSQQRSDPKFRQACEMVRNVRIGKLHTIRVGLPPDSGTGNPAPMRVPPNLNYEVWLGPRSEAPYTQDRVHPQKGFGRPGWLQNEAYCLGMITGWGAHMNDIAQWGNGTDDTGPIEFEATAEFPDRGLFDVHTQFFAKAKYANGVWLIMKTDKPGVTFEGDRGAVHVRRGGIEANPKDLLDEKIGSTEIVLPRSDNHMLNFLESMRSRQDPIAPVEVGHRSNSICLLSHIAMKIGRKIKWDPKAQLIVDDNEANKLLDYPHRKPWTT